MREERVWSVSGLHLVLVAIALVSLRPASQQIDPRGPMRFPTGLESPPEPAPAEPSSASTCGREAPVPNVYLHSGEFHLSATDLRIAGRGLDFAWARKYRSRHGATSALGHGWDFAYNARIEQVGAAVRLHDGNTRRDLYFPLPDGSYTALQFFREGGFNPDGTFTLTFADGGTWNFRALDASPGAGKLASILDRNGNALALSYDGAGRLVQITDTLGRAITVAYDAGGRIQSLTDFGGRSVTYAYYGAAEPGGSLGDLKSVTTPPVAGFALGKTTVYTYSKGFADERLNHNLLTVTDPKGQTWLVNTYSSETQPGALYFDRLVRQRRGNPGEDIKIETELLPLSLVSSAKPPQLAPSQAATETLLVIVNDRVGNVMECTYDLRGRLTRKREYTGRANPALPTTSALNRPLNPLRPDDPAFFETRYAYNPDSLVTHVVHPNGNETTKVYELALDPAAPWRTRGNLRELRRTPGTHVPVGDQLELVELFEYETGFGGCCGVSFVDRHVDARGNETLHTYDMQGNRLHTQHRIPSVVEDWEYNAFGQMTAHVLPDNGGAHRRRDEYRYYGPLDGAQNGHLKEVAVDAPNLALTTRYEYDALGRVLRTIDPRGNDTLWTVNALDQVTIEESPLVAGQRIKKLFTYDANDNLLELDVENRNENGVLQANSLFTTSWLYGILNEVARETREVDPGSNVVTEYAYDANRNRTLVRKGEAFAGIQPTNTVTTLHDERDLVFRVIRADGDPGESTDQSDWDGNGNERARREGLEDGAHVTSYVYDAFDRLVTTVDPMGNTTEHHYDPNGNLGGRVGDEASSLHPFATRVTGQLLDSSATPGTTRLSEEMVAYDTLDRLIQRDVRHFDTETQAAIGDGQTTTTQSWTANSQLESRAGDGAGQVTSYEYDTANRLVRSTDAKLNQKVYDYDAAGNVVQVQESEVPDIAGPLQVFTRTLTYDALDRLATRVDGQGSVRTYKYDSRGNRVLKTDPLGHDTRYAYDGLDRLVSSARDMNDNGLFTEAVDVILLQTWDRSSRQTSGTDDRGNPTRYAYDALDRLIVTQMADGTIDQNGTGATWILGQPSPNLSGFTSGWDAHDSLEVHRDAVGSTVTSTYDALERELSRVIVRGPSVLGTTSETYQYDGLSRRISAIDNDSAVTRGSASTSGHDSLGNVLRETQRILPGGPLRTITATYDGRGNQTGLVYPGGRSIARTFDVLDRPTLVREEPAGPSSTISTYLYVGPERLLRRDHGNGTRFQPTYDGIDGIPNAPGDFGVRQLSRTFHRKISGGTVIDDRTNLWDRAGNKSQQSVPSPAETRTYAYDVLDRLITSTVSPGGSVSYVFDGAGNRTSVVGGPDPGAYVANAVNAYTTTPFDTRTNDANGNLFSQTSPTRTYRYDYRDQLVQYTDAGTGLTTTYRYDCLGRRIEKTVGGTTTRHYYDGEEEIEEQSSANVTSATWVHSNGRHSLLQMVRAGQKYYYHEDELGSVRKVTDSSAAVTDSVEYDDYGTPTISTNSPFTLAQAPGQAGAQDSDLDAGSAAYSLIDADTFTPGASGQVATVRWWGAYDQSPPATDDFWIQIRADSGGLPGGLVAQRHVANAVSRTATGQLIGGFYDEYSYQATLSPAVSVSAGTTYWLVVYANSAGYSGTWRWEQSYGGNGLSAYNYDSFGWSQSSGDYACELDVTTGPPPSGNPFLYLGTRTEPGSARSQARGRERDPRTGRHLQRDDVEWWRWRGHQGNAYTFAGNNPVTLGDIADSLREETPSVGHALGMTDSGQWRVLPFQGLPSLPVSSPSTTGECRGRCGGSSGLLRLMKVGDKPWSEYSDKVQEEMKGQAVAVMIPFGGPFRRAAKVAANRQCAEREGHLDCTCEGGEYKEAFLEFDEDVELKGPDGEVLKGADGKALTKRQAAVKVLVVYEFGHCAHYL